MRASETNRIAKVLEGTNLKLGSVSTNIGGVSGRAILTALVENTTDPEVLAELARGRLRNKHDALVAALTGRVGTHQRFLLAAQLRHLADLDELIEGLDARDQGASSSRRAGDRAARHHPVRRSPDRRGPHRRDRTGHEPLRLERSAGAVEES